MDKEMDAIRDLLQSLRFYYTTHGKRAEAIVMGYGFSEELISALCVKDKDSFMGIPIYRSSKMFNYILCEKLGGEC